MTGTPPDSRPLTVLSAGHKLRTLDRVALTRCLRLEPVEAHLIADSPSPQILIERLEKAGLVLLMLRLFSYALPPREAIWWAAMCTGHSAPSGRPRRLLRAAEAAEAWVRQPLEVAVAEAGEAARRAGRTDPEAWLAVAVTWASRDPLVLPVGRAVEMAVTLASMRDNPRLRNDRMRQFKASGLDVASGGGGRLTPEARGGDV